MNVGDRIRDIEDGDCYFEGVIVSLNPIKYKIEKIIWGGERDRESAMVGQETEQIWWELKLIE